MPSAVVTGITGQDGAYLAQLLASWAIGVSRPVSNSATTNLDRLGITQSIQLFPLDLTDKGSIGAYFM